MVELCSEFTLLAIKALVKVPGYSKHSKEKYGPHCTVSNTKFSSVTLNELVMKAKEKIL